MTGPGICETTPQRTGWTDPRGIPLGFRTRPSNPTEGLQQAGNDRWCPKGTCRRRVVLCPHADTEHGLLLLGNANLEQKPPVAGWTPSARLVVRGTEVRCGCRRRGRSQVRVAHARMRQIDRSGKRAVATDTSILRGPWRKRDPASKARGVRPPIQPGTGAGRGVGQNRAAATDIADERRHRYRTRGSGVAEPWSHVAPEILPCAAWGFGAGTATDNHPGARLGRSGENIRDVDVPSPGLTGTRKFP